MCKCYMYISMWVHALLGVKELIGVCESRLVCEWVCDWEVC